MTHPTEINTADQRDSITRRELFPTVARWSALVALAGVGVAVTTTDGPLDPACINRGRCSRCAVFKRCSLPLAQSKKASTSKQSL